MNRTLSIFTLVVAIVAVSACATLASKDGKSGHQLVDVAAAKDLHERDA